jgi:hypothetical protein
VFFTLTHKTEAGGHGVFVPDEAKQCTHMRGKEKKKQSHNNQNFFFPSVRIVAFSVKRKIDQDAFHDLKKGQGLG